MTNLNINIGNAIEKAQSAALRHAEVSAETAARQIVSDLFRSKDVFNKTEGMAREIIRQKIEEYVLSDAFSRQMDAAIEAAMAPAAAEAVQTLLNSKTRKVLFDATSGRMVD